MWVLLGTTENETYHDSIVYFIGVFDDLQAAIQKRDEIVAAKRSNKIAFPIKKISINTDYTYRWSCSEEDEVL